MSNHYYPEEVYQALSIYLQRPGGDLDAVRGAIPTLDVVYPPSVDANGVVHLAIQHGHPDHDLPRGQGLPRPSTTYASIGPEGVSFDDWQVGHRTLSDDMAMMQSDLTDQTLSAVWEVRPESVAQVRRRIEDAVVEGKQVAEEQPDQVLEMLSVYDPDQGRYVFDDSQNTEVLDPLNSQALLDFLERRAGDAAHAAQAAIEEHASTSIGPASGADVMESFDSLRDSSAAALQAHLCFTEVRDQASIAVGQFNDDDIRVLNPPAIQRRVDSTTGDFRATAQRVIATYGVHVPEDQLSAVAPPVGDYTAVAKPFADLGLPAQSEVLALVQESLPGQAGPDLAEAVAADLRRTLAITHGFPQSSESDTNWITGTVDPALNKARSIERATTFLRQFEPEDRQLTLATSTARATEVEVSSEQGTFCIDFHVDSARLFPITFRPTTPELPEGMSLYVGAHQQDQPDDGIFDIIKDYESNRSAKQHQQQPSQQLTGRLVHDLADLGPSPVEPTVLAPRVGVNVEVSSGGPGHYVLTADDPDSTLSLLWNSVNAMPGEFDTLHTWADQSAAEVPLGSIRTAIAAAEHGHDIPEALDDYHSSLEAAASAEPSVRQSGPSPSGEVRPSSRSQPPSGQTRDQHRR